MLLFPDITSSLFHTVVTAAGEFAASMSANQVWRFCSTTACWIKQANPTGTITCATKANLADPDYITINDGINAAVLYEFDTAGDGVTGGRIAVAVSAATTAATVAVILKAAIEAQQPYITVTHNGSGVLSLSSTTRNITITENVTHASMTVSYGPVASAAAGSMFVGPNEVVTIDGANGSNLSVIRNAADGSASLTRVIKF